MKNRISGKCGGCVYHFIVENFDDPTIMHHECHKMGECEYTKMDFTEPYKIGGNYYKAVVKGEFTYRS